MCFIKTIETGPKTVVQPCQYNCHLQSERLYTSDQFFPFLTYPNILNFGYQFQSINDPKINILESITAQISANNTELNKITEVIDELQKNLRKNEITLQQAKQHLYQISQQSHLQSPVNQQKHFQTRKMFVAKLFGPKQYYYRMKLVHDFPRILYKQRRIDLKVQIIGTKKQIIRNGNFLHVCLAACDINGKWIGGPEGQGFFGGRVEMDLLGGEAEFKKVYPFEISRHLKDGRLAIIVYAKSSMLSHSLPSPGQRVVIAQEIQPLCIENIVVKAKKRHRT